MLCVLGGCADAGTPASAYRYFGDRIRVATGIGEPCLEYVGDLTPDGYARRPAEQCYRFQAPHEMHGIWTYGEETSDFEDLDQGQSGGTSNGNDRSRYWIDRNPDVRLVAHGCRVRFPSGQAEVRFVGRPTAVAGTYGHFGGSKRLIVIDRMVSARTINGDPPALPDCR